MPLPLSEREREVLEAMVRFGVRELDEAADQASPARSETVSRAAAQSLTASRTKWLEQVAGVQRGARCGCGTCPSIELVDDAGNPPPDDPKHRVVLSAGVPGAMVLLFIDDDQLSYLELAPLDDSEFAEFPPATQLTFDP